MENINTTASLEMLLKVVTVYKEIGNELYEPCDLANELGLILGEQCTDPESLIRDFVAGFKHGVELSANTTADERFSFLKKSTLSVRQ